MKKNELEKKTYTLNVKLTKIGGGVQQVFFMIGTKNKF